jgi:putative glycosyltransferase (TIGR04348 family)
VHRDTIVIVTPALADANNGNWQTAHRWADMLRSAYRVKLVAQWSDGAEALMIALHARKSASSSAAWRARQSRRPLIVTLTGTDLYRDIDVDAGAQRSLALADALVVLNERGADRLPAHCRSKCRVVLQSSPSRLMLRKTGKHLRALMVGHLRDEKDPQTYFRAAQRLAHRTDIRLDHVGSALDVSLGEEATALALVQPKYRWLHGLSHRATLRRIQAAHVLAHPSRMEGGAHVVIEAIRSGTPVLASRIDGNLGLLGADYEGVFSVGDDLALADLLERARDEPGFLQRLQDQVVARAHRFSPEAESAALLGLVNDLMRRSLAGSELRGPPLDAQRG